VNKLLAGGFAGCQGAKEENFFPAEHAEHAEK
jgi:hypothetical protein